MGMFHWYEPVPPLTCPACDDPLADWQGKSADCSLFVWRQGERRPVEWRVDSEVQVSGVLASAQLPKSFDLYAFDSNHHKVIAEGQTRDGGWASTNIVAVVQSHASRNGGQFVRVLWGKADWLPKRTRDR